jgi:hypothetical protein
MKKGYCDVAEGGLRVAFHGGRRVCESGGAFTSLTILRSRVEMEPVKCLDNHEIAYPALHDSARRRLSVE